MKRTWGRWAIALLGALALAVVGCAALKESRPGWPIKEYEKIIAGRLDADYVGTDRCVTKCHTHDQLASDFRLSIHGEQVSAETKLPLVNCESCHGPGSLAIAGIKNETCDFKTLIPLTIPAGAQSLTCLKCHAGQSLANLSGWSASRHAAADVSCWNCHKLHKGPGQKIKKSEIAAACLSCHEEKRTLFNLSSHHPVLEGKMTCSDCHDPHGTSNDHDLRQATVRNSCVGCHMEKQGPFVYEHANLSLDCTNCHDPHGSTNRRLTKYAQPFLCLQCHNGHNSGTHLGLKTPYDKAVFFTNCSSCHSAIHGSDLKGFRNDDRFTR